jgi:hypothetical protein
MESSRFPGATIGDLSELHDQVERLLGETVRAAIQQFHRLAEFCIGRRHLGCLARGQRRVRKINANEVKRAASIGSSSRI